MPAAKTTTKKPNLVSRFFSAIGRGIAAFFVGIWIAIWAVITFIWELVWTIVTFVYDLVIKIIQATLKYVLMIWGFVLATILVAALLVWLVTLSIKNIDETRVGDVYISELTPAITQAAQELNEVMIQDMLENKEAMLREELRKLQDDRIGDLEDLLDDITE